MVKKREPEKKAGPPAWMLSFSDMMTNMLCFFILLVSLAHQRESGYLSSGMGSYLQKLEQIGLPGLRPSTRTLIPRDSPLARYRAPRVDPKQEENWVEYSQKMIREEFDRLKDATTRFETPGRSVPIPLGISFLKNSSRLSLEDRRSLDLLVGTIREVPGSVEVLGSCDRTEASGFAAERGLSLQRAIAVTRYLAEAGVPADRLIPVGAGSTPPASGASGHAGLRKVQLQWVLDAP